MKNIRAVPHATPSSYWLAGFARCAGDITDIDDREQTHDWYKTLLRPYVPPSVQSVLDVGCGRGRVIRALAALAPGVCCVGIDGNETTLAAAKRELTADGLDATLYKVDVTESGFEQVLAPHHAHFDLITSLFVLHHYRPARAGAILHELRKMLAPSGVLVLAEAHDPADPNAAMSEQVCAELAALAGEPPDLLWTEAELREACRLGGFDEGESSFEVAPGCPFTEAEAVANDQALDRLWTSVHAAEAKLSCLAAASKLATLKGIISKMRKYDIARPARFGPLLAIVRQTIPAH